MPNTHRFAKELIKAVNNGPPQSVGQQLNCILIGIMCQVADINESFERIADSLELIAGKAKPEEGKPNGHS